MTRLRYNRKRAVKAIAVTLISTAVLITIWVWNTYRVNTVPVSITSAANPDYACMLGAAGADVEVRITQTDSTCAQWVRSLAPIGLNWHFISQMTAPYASGPADGETMYKVCTLSGGASGNMLVEDAGSTFYGDSICSQEEANGWAPNESTQS